MSSKYTLKHTIYLNGTFVYYAASRGWWGQLTAQGTPGLKIRVRAQPSDFHVIIIMMGAGCIP